MKQEFLLGGDLSIKRLGFGAMRLPCNGFRTAARDPKTGLAVLRRAIELGVNHIDTAEFYQSSDGTVQANQLIREALYPYPSDLVIATKIGAIFEPNGEFKKASGADMRSLVEENLRSLGLECIDLVYLRPLGMEVPHNESIAERFEALAALQEEGLIRHLGLSNVGLRHIEEAQTIAPVAAVQNNFHIAKRDDIEVLKVCEASGIAFVPFFPLGGGMTDISNERLAKIAEQHGASISQIALAWLLALSPVSLAIPGTGSLSHLDENMAAASIRLTDENLAELAQIDQS